MASLASQVKIANMALVGLGADQILSLTEDSENARKVKAVFDLLRDEVLRKHPWNFAIDRRSLNLLAAAPAYEWANAFQIQGDIIRIIEAETNDVEFVQEGDKILTNEGTFNCKCIVRITDTTKWSTDFVTCFAARLEAELAYAIVDSRPLAADKYKVYLDKISKAKGTDAQESSSQQELEANLWLRSRSGGSEVPLAQ